MKSLFRGAFFRGVSATMLSASLVACTANPQPLNRPGDVPPAFATLRMAVLQEFLAQLV